MAEFIGAAAAIPQLAKYSFSAANAVPDFARRIRKAPITQNRWVHQARLLTNTSLEACRQLDTNIIPSPIMDRLTEDLNSVQSALHKTTIHPDDGRIVKMWKKIKVVKKETEMNEEMLAISQRIVLCSHLVTLNHVKGVSTVPSQSSPASTNTLVAHNVQSTDIVPPILLSQVMISTTRNAKFIGHVDLLHKISTKVKVSAQSITAIHGLGGLGKTDLAAELAHRLHGETTDLSTFWLDAATNDTLTTGLRAIDGLADIADNTSEALAAAVIRWTELSVPSERLLIIDNIDVDSVASTALENLLRPKRHHHILFITRSRRIALAYAHPTDIVDMPAMSEGDAQQLLRSYIGADAWDGASIASLVEKLEYHPLAIKSAGIYIASTGTRLTRFLALLEQDASFLTALLDETVVPQYREAVRQGDYGRIYTLKTLVARNENVATTLFVLSSMDCSDLPEESITALADTKSKQEAIDILKAYSLLKPITRTTKWKMPELVRQTARSQLSSSPDRARFLSAALQFVVPHGASRVAAASFSREHHAHIASVLTAVVALAPEREFSPGIIKLAFQLSTILCQFLVDQGKPYEAIAASSRFIAWAPISVQKFVSAFDKLQSKLSVAYHGSGQFAVAERITREVLQSQIYTIGENHLETLHSLNNIGLYQWEQGRFSLAERCHRKVLDLTRTICGPPNLEIFFTLNNLALSLQSQEKLQEAEVFFVQALRGRKAQLSVSHPDVLVSKSNLGVLRALQGRFELARQLHDAALKGRETILGSAHPETLKSKGNLALALQEMGHYDQSVEFFRDICQTYKETLGPSHPQAIQSLRNLAYVLHRQSKFAEAEVLIREVLDVLEKKHGKCHPETFKTLQYLATLLHWQGSLEDALDMMASLYDMQKAMLDENHMDAMDSWRYLAELEAELVASEQGPFIVISCVL